MRKKSRCIVLPAPLRSKRLLVTVTPSQTGMFRFLLEGYENLAGFTMLDRHRALLKLFFSPHQEQEVLSALEAIGRTVPLRIAPWPDFRRGDEKACGA